MPTNPSTAREVRIAAAISWMLVSAVVLLVLVAPWALTAGQISALVPKCEWEVKYNRECAFCGMTTAFLEIARGDLAGARSANRGAIPLYAALWLNEAAAALLLSRILSANTGGNR